MSTTLSSIAAIVAIVVVLCALFGPRTVLKAAETFRKGVSLLVDLFGEIVDFIHALYHSNRVQRLLRPLLWFLLPFAVALLVGVPTCRTQFAGNNSLCGVVNTFTNLRGFNQRGATAIPNPSPHDIEFELPASTNITIAYITFDDGRILFNHTVISRRHALLGNLAHLSSKSTQVGDALRRTNAEFSKSLRRILSTRWELISGVEKGPRCNGFKKIFSSCPSADIKASRQATAAQAIIEELNTLVALVSKLLQHISDLDRSLHAAEMLIHAEWVGARAEHVLIADSLWTAWGGNKNALSSKGNIVRAIRNFFAYSNRMRHEIGVRNELLQRIELELRTLHAHILQNGSEESSTVDIGDLTRHIEEALVLLHAARDHVTALM